MTPAARELGPGRGLRRAAGPALALAIAVLAVYGQAVRFGFSSYDDTVYVSENPLITAGVTWEGLREVVLHGHHLLWTPLTSLSYMIGCELHGVNPAGHHVDSVILHIIAAWLVFLAVWRYTGSWWPAWFVAAIFALHPLNVESVAWVSSRKNQLYAIFWMLSLLAYRRYAITPGLRAYLPVLLLHLCGLASKPTHLMLPCVLLLLDIWPLGRIAPGALFSAAGVQRGVALLVEKMPLFALSLSVSVWTLGTVEDAGGMRDLTAVPLTARLENTAYVYAFFVAKLFWPSGLAIHYPYPTGPLPVPMLWGAVALLFALSLAAAASLLRGRSVFFVGWCWFLVVLLPESGLLRANSFLMADRYAYVSTLGLMIAFVWPLHAFAGRHPRAAGVAALATLFVLGGISFRQAAYWQDDITLFSRTAALYPEGPVGHNSLGVALKKAGRTEEAIASFERAYAAPGPFKVLPKMNLGTACFELGRYAASVVHFEEVTARSPLYVPALVWAARAQALLGNGAAVDTLLDRAAIAAPQDPDLLAALAGRTPDLVRGHTETGMAFLLAGRPAEALAQFQRALGMDPGARDAELGAIAAELISKGPQENIAAIQGFLASAPDGADKWLIVAMAMLALGQDEQAKEALQRAHAIAPSDPRVILLEMRLSPK